MSATTATPTTAQVPSSKITPQMATRIDGMVDFIVDDLAKSGIKSLDLTTGIYAVCAGIVKGEISLEDWKGLGL